MKKIYSDCPKCSATGIETITTIVGDEPVQQEITCRMCSGDAKVSNLYLSSDLMDFLNDLKNKVNDIFEKVNE